MDLLHSKNERMIIIKQNQQLNGFRKNKVLIFSYVSKVYDSLPSFSRDCSKARCYENLFCNADAVFYFSCR